MASTLDIRRRIKSVKNTKQITKAMEKISAIKMRKSQVAALKSRRYASLALEIMVGFEGKVEKHAHPLLEERKVERVGILVISTDRGLCGSLNTKLTQKILSTLGEKDLALDTIKLYTIGKKCKFSGLTSHLPPLS